MRRDRATSPAQPVTGDRRGNGNRGDPRTPGVELSKGSLRPSTIPEGLFRSWPITVRSGVPLLPPYMPAGLTGMSERVSKSQPVGH